MLDDILFTMDAHLSAQYAWFQDYQPDLMPSYIWRALVLEVEQPIRRMDDVVELYDPAVAESGVMERWDGGPNGW